MVKDMEYYISKGFDQVTAEYFSSGRKKIVLIEANTDFTLTLLFDNGEKRIFDVKPLLEVGTVFEPFMNYENFKRVYLDDTNCVSWDIDPNVDNDIVWSNKVDLCPDSCYIDSIPVKEAL